jgi:hypothetical protein
VEGGRGGGEGGRGGGYLYKKGIVEIEQERNRNRKRQSKETHTATDTDRGGHRHWKRLRYRGRQNRQGRRQRQRDRDRETGAYAAPARALLPSAAAAGTAAPSAACCAQESARGQGGGRPQCPWRVTRARRGVSSSGGKTGTHFWRGAALCRPARCERHRCGRGAQARELPAEGLDAGLQGAGAAALLARQRRKLGGESRRGRRCSGGELREQGVSQTAAPRQQDKTFLGIFFRIAGPTDSFFGMQYSRRIILYKMTSKSNSITS